MLDRGTTTASYQCTFLLLSALITSEAFSQNKQHIANMQHIVDICFDVGEMRGDASRYSACT